MKSSRDGDGSHILYYTKSSRDGDKSEIDMIMFPDRLNEFSSILNTHEGLSYQ